MDSVPTGLEVMTCITIEDRPEIAQTSGLPAETMSPC